MPLATHRIRARGDGFASIAAAATAAAAANTAVAVAAATVAAAASAAAATSACLPAEATTPLSPPPPPLPPGNATELLRATTAGLRAELDAAREEVASTTSRLSEALSEAQQEAAATCERLARLDAYSAASALWLFAAREGAGAYRTLLTYFSRHYPKVASAGGECAAELSRALLLTSECADEDEAPSIGPGLGPAGEMPSAATEM
ncbi:hypothetical protein T492DRAFT_898753 [Pavlovales sp. CCMP2436]|nr:hypothetical protein T492DRAFT_898753 [Pavlovales sp. CCMP2436]